MNVFLRSCAHPPLFAAGAALALLWAFTGECPAAIAATPEPRPSGRSDPLAVRLLTDAAAAAGSVSYSGTEVSTAWHPSGESTSVAHLAHTPGAGTLIQSAGGAKGGLGALALAPESAAAVGGFTPRMVSLLTAGYTLERAADGRMCDRPARVVEARRPGGDVAGRFWIDRDTGVLLHREVYDETGRTVLSTGFQDFTVAPPLLRRGRAGLLDGRFQAAALTPWTGETVRGRPVAGLTLYDVRRSGGTLHLAYSDGLSAVSVFVQRGVLDAGSLPAGWRPSTVRGFPVHVRDAQQQWVVWGAHGHVYTVVADSPAATVEAVVAALPHDAGASGDGPWSRIRRGLGRLASWVDPFS